MNTRFDFAHANDGAWLIWLDGHHLGTLLRHRDRWEAFDHSGAQLVNDERRPLLFRTRQAAATELERLWRE